MNTQRVVWKGGAFPGLVAFLQAVTGCCSETETVARVESPIYAEWTRTETTELLSGGKFSLWGTRYNHDIVISRSPPISASVDCSGPEPELAGDPIGDRLAYRCEAGDWRMLHLGMTGEAFEVEEPGLGDDKTPNWAAGETFEQSARNWITTTNEPERWYAEAKARDLMLFARLLFAEAESGPVWKTEPWDKKYDALPALVQEEVKSMFRARILQPKAPPALVYLAAVHMHEDEEIAPALLERASEMVAAKQEDAQAAVTRVLLSLAPKRPKETADLACRTLESWPSVWWAPMLVIGKTKTQCAAATALAKDTSYICKAMLSCASDAKFRLCSAEEVATEVEKALVSTDDARPGLAPLAAWYAQGPLPEELTRAVARANYRVVEPDHPSCGDVDATCKCSDQGSFHASLPGVLCKLGSTPGEGDLAIGGCSVRVDDDRKQIIVVRPSD